MRGPSKLPLESLESIGQVGWIENAWAIEIRFEEKSEWWPNLFLHNMSLIVWIFSICIEYRE